MYRVLFVALLSSASLGCGGSSGNLTSLPASFAMIEGSANELCSRVLDPKYKGARDLGTDSDRMGMALGMFMKEAEGGPFSADAKAISEKMSQLDRMAGSRAPVEKQREAAKELQAAVATLKAKM